MEDIEYKRVASTDIGPYWVSTVWLGIDHNWLGDGPPIIFETMVFSKGERDDPGYHGLHDMDMDRYATEEEALAGHEAMCLMVRATLQEEPPTEEPETGGNGAQNGPDVAFFVAYDALNRLQ